MPLPCLTDGSLDPVNRPCSCTGPPGSSPQAPHLGPEEMGAGNGHRPYAGSTTQKGASYWSPSGGPCAPGRGEGGRLVALASETNKSQLLPPPPRLPRASSCENLPQAAPTPSQHPPGDWLCHQRCPFLAGAGGSRCVRCGTQQSWIKCSQPPPLWSSPFPDPCALTHNV